MAGECLGSAYPRYRYENFVSIHPKNDEIVWVKKRYTPTDLRQTAPTSRRKFVAYPAIKSGVPQVWRRPVDAPSHIFARDSEESRLLPYSHATRCEEWSTLRQILPSVGYIQMKASPRWGTGPPHKYINYNRKAPSRFPHINSPMTRYVDDIHINHQRFDLY
ncbi:uncharacterized protein LOC124441420 [Xenia sp. Carnegie-2017]|uniref:uncharacterized protein LOC124441420 n=1 Tax=Xenia sp. Carnegie-2017 TaxID=2897299 RepID=UPI001F033EE8|nr:uncharacterized protein LOC124441420 [Xenia sp. Carnegie-2017]